MGMFDDVTCEVPLPDGKPHGALFQTKDFSNCLDRITMRADGRLIFQQSEWSDIQTPPPNDMQFDGILNFYGCDDRDCRIWREFFALYVDGNLAGIVDYRTLPEDRESFFAEWKRTRVIPEALLVSATE